MYSVPTQLLASAAPATPSRIEALGRIAEPWPPRTGATMNSTTMRVEGTGETLACPLSMQEYLEPEDQIERVYIAVRMPSGKVAPLSGRILPDGYRIGRHVVTQAYFQGWLDAILNCGLPVIMRAYFN